MKRIYKYPLEVIEEQTIDMHEGDILTLQLQDGKPVLWAEVDPSSISKVTILCYGTGQDIKEDRIIYLNTVQIGVFVWHYYMKF